MSSGKVNVPQTWNRYAYTNNNPLNLIDIAGLYTYGDGATTDRQAQFEKWHAELKTAKSRYKLGSKQYNRIQAVLDVLGAKGAKGVVIRFDTKASDGQALENNVGARATPNLSITGKKISTNFEITFNPNSKLGSASELAHEGQHLVDFKAALSHAKIGANGLINITAQYDLSRYDREDRGYETGQFVSRALDQDDVRTSAIMRGEEIPLYKSAWAESDKQTLMNNNRERYLLEGTLIFPVKSPKYSEQINKQLQP